jgi:hypothetical protein
MKKESVFLKEDVSDTDCPPSPPSYDLNEIFQKSVLETPIQNEKFESLSQTDLKMMNSAKSSCLRRSSRLAQKKMEKQKLDHSPYSAKKIKFN